VSVAAEKWKTLQLRINGLQKSFQKANYKPGEARLNANDLLHPRNATRPWTIAYCKGMERIAATLDMKFFIVVIDKRTTDKPAHPKWLLPLSYFYLMKPIGQFLREANSFGSLVIPPGRDDERHVLSELQFSNVFTTSRSIPIVSSPMIQREEDSAGLQIADFVATVARRYHEHAYPKLYLKETLEGYDAAINSHYQGFVKPHTFQSSMTDSKGYKIRGYIYLWRKDKAQGGHGGAEGGESTGSMAGNYESTAQVSESRAKYAAEEQSEYGNK
jgi:hypothetical protein